MLVEKAKGSEIKNTSKGNTGAAKAQHKEEGWKEVQKKNAGNSAKPQREKALQDTTNKAKGKNSIKKDARGKGKPLATMLEDKENYFCSTVNLSDD